MMRSKEISFVGKLSVKGLDFRFYREKAALWIKPDGGQRVGFYLGDHWHICQYLAMTAVKAFWPSDEDIASAYCGDTSQRQWVIDLVCQVKASVKARPVHIREEAVYWDGKKTKSQVETFERNEMSTLISTFYQRCQKFQAKIVRQISRQVSELLSGARSAAKSQCWDLYHASGRWQMFYHWVPLELALGHIDPSPFLAQNWARWKLAMIAYNPINHAWDGALTSRNRKQLLQLVDSLPMKCVERLMIEGNLRSPYSYNVWQIFQSLSELCPSEKVHAAERKYEETMFGYKRLEWENGQFISPHRRTPWRDGHLTAKPPDRDKANGIYSTESITEILEQYGGLVCRLALGGKIIVHDSGYRSEWARVTHVLVSQVAATTVDPESGKETIHMFFAPGLGSAWVDWLEFSEMYCDYDVEVNMIGINFMDLEGRDGDR